MFVRDFNLFTEEKIDPPEIIWEKDDRYALIAFLLLSVNREIDAEDIKKLDTFMGITQMVTVSSDDEADDRQTKLRIARDTIIREGNIYLENVSRYKKGHSFTDVSGEDEDRYDGIIDELDRIIEGKDKCNIGNGYALLGKTTKYKKLDGAPYWLFEYLEMVVDNKNINSEVTSCSYYGNRPRIMKYLARKWDIDISVLPVLEASVDSLNEISCKRDKIENSGMPHREAVSALAALTTEEKEVWKKLNALNIAKDRTTSAYVTNTNAVADAIASLGGEPTWVRIRDEDEPYEEEEEEEEESLSDRIGDGIVEGIQKVTDIICAPFDWMTEKINGL